MSKRDKNLYLQDIIECISKISKYTGKLTFVDFAKTPIIIDAVIRNLEIIGEAAKNIPQEYKSAHKEIPWRKMIDMRNKVVHEYFGVDTEILWATIKKDLPTLKRQIKAL